MVVMNFKNNGPQGVLFSLETQYYSNTMQYSAWVAQSYMSVHRTSIKVLELVKFLARYYLHFATNWDLIRTFEGRYICGFY